VNALAEGIRSADTTRLMTGHAGQKSPREAFGDPAWLQLDNTYSYDKNLVPALLRDVRRAPRQPVFLSETTYEGEHKAPPEQIRRQMWQAALCGHCGHVFGNHPIWHFDGPGLFPDPQPWREALTSHGSRDMARWAQMLRHWPWERLQPAPQRLTTAPEGAACAHAAAEALLLAYTPGGAITLALPAEWKDRVVSVEWWAPTGDSLKPETKATRAWEAFVSLAPPGAQDWVVAVKIVN
jgi:hypothetical protein